MDNFPLLVAEFGQLLSGPVLTETTDNQRTTTLFLYDALGIMFMQNACLPIDSVEFSWLALRAKYLVQHAEQIIGKQWKTETPWAASVLTIALSAATPTARWV